MADNLQKFWDFSLAVYADETVAQACLALQDLHGLDVNLLLFCYWYAQRHGACEADVMARAIALSSAWRAEVVQPLRTIRKGMKGKAAAFDAAQGDDFERLRDRIKFDELAAEKYQQQMLEHLCAGQTDIVEIPKRREFSENNLALMMEGLNLELTGDIRRQLDEITAVVFDAD